MIKRQQKSITQAQTYVVALLLYLRMKIITTYSIFSQKSEALDNIKSLYKQNIKSCYAKRRRRHRRTVKQQLAKKQLARAAHFFCTFLCLCFARLQRETSRNFLDVTLLFGGNAVPVLVHFYHTCLFSPCISGR